MARLKCAILSASYFNSLCFILSYEKASCFPRRITNTLGQKQGRTRRGAGWRFPWGLRPSAIQRGPHHTVKLYFYELKFIFTNTGGNTCTTRDSNNHPPSLIQQPHTPTHTETYTHTHKQTHTDTDIHMHTNLHTHIHTHTCK